MKEFFPPCDRCDSEEHGTAKCTLFCAYYLCKRLGDQCSNCGPNPNFECPKCKMTGGNDWSQCRGKCPLEGTPHYDEYTANIYDNRVFSDMFKLLQTAGVVEPPKRRIDDEIPF